MDAMLRRRQMMLAGGSPTPPGPAEPVFYDQLVFDGVAYIDTTIVPPNNASMRVTFGNETLKAAQRCFFVPGAETTTFMAMLLNTGTTSTTRKFSVYYGGGTALNTAKTLAFSSTRVGFFMTPYRFGWGNTAGNITTYSKGSDTPGGGLILGSNSVHNGSPFSGTMEQFEIYGSDAQNVTTNNGFASYTPVYTLRPCTYNGEAGMWCVETSQFFGNTAGAGNLTVQNRT